MFHASAVRQPPAALLTVMRMKCMTTVNIDYKLLLTSHLLWLLTWSWPGWPSCARFAV